MGHKEFGGCLPQESFLLEGDDSLKRDFSDANNSGTNWLSLHVLHRLFYRHLVQKALPYLEKYLVLSEETKIFNRDNYGVPESLMEFYPLGGIIPTNEEYEANRKAKRLELGVKDDEILFVHSGKLDKLKRTEELIKAFASIDNNKLKLVIIGSIPDDMKNVLLPLIDADKRVNFIGWKNSDELIKYLCASDLYCQPGSQSATMQNAVCAGCAILLYPHESYAKDFDYENIVWVKNQEDMVQAFQRIEAGSVDLDTLKESSRRCARELLDYRKLAARLYQ